MQHISTTEFRDLQWSDDDSGLEDIGQDDCHTFQCNTADHGGVVMLERCDDVFELPRHGDALAAIKMDRDCSIQISASDHHVASMLCKKDEGPNPQRHTFMFDVGDTDSDQFITTFNACGDIVLSNETLPAEQRSRFVFSAGRPFAIDALNSTCDVVIGMNTSAQPTKTFQANPGVPEYDNAGAVLCPFLNIDGSTSFFAGSEELLQQADGNSQINVFGSTPYVFQTQAANLTQCFVSVQGQTVLPGSTIIQATFTNDSAVLLDSNRNITVTTAVAAYQISDGTTTKTIPIKFRQDFENNPQMFKSISDGAGGYKLTGPNIASFIGEPYVTLSIEELDSHLTRASNLVYNFMGIDHTMTLLIRYYGMPAPEFDYKKLAPSYEPTQSGPDFQMNRVQQMFDDGESDNDDGM
eukprot:jgi/Astpho2/5767/fgenesh1_pg.00080_%23_30_t